jgi:hypothetical protein
MLNEKPVMVIVLGFVEKKYYPNDNIDLNEITIKLLSYGSKNGIIVIVRKN